MDPTERSIPPEIMTKHILDVIIRLAEVNQDVALVFAFRKLLGDITFTNPTNTVDQQGAAPSIHTLPLKKPIVDFSPHVNLFLR